MSDKASYYDHHDLDVTPIREMKNHNGFYTRNCTRCAFGSK